MRHLIATSIIIITPSMTITKSICSGNLGENIFTAGDFGVGASPVVIEDPNIEPGYD
ncbi:MAG: hypothetical protein ACI86M_003215 [Saprospiraceae bacterium]|jgi:hypothetical protein